jgi:hypothetical protein
MFANQPILKIISVFSGVRVTRYVVLCVCFVDRCLYFLLWPLCCLYTDFYYLFGIFKLVLITAMKSLVDIQLLEPLILLHHSIEYIYLQNVHLAIADSTHLLWIKIYEKLGNICEELSPLIYRWRFSSSGLYTINKYYQFYQKNVFKFPLFVSKYACAS